MMKPHPMTAMAAAACLLTLAAPAGAADWSDTSIGAKYGERFTEPGGTQKIDKTIYEFVHVSGDRLGKNLVVGQVLTSGSNDPAAGGGTGAQEFYGLYRRTLSLSKLTGSTLAFGPVKDVSLVGRFDRGTKNISMAAAARKLMAGVSLDLAVPKGFAEAVLYAYHEKNYNGIVGQAVKFDTTYRADLVWGIPFNLGIPLEWRGGLAIVGAKGKDGFGNDTKVEKKLYTEVMAGIGKTGFQVGLAYEWWRNKYGVDASRIPGANQGTPLLVAEYHF
jgi:nucleoside-specific outer membrane channel protein Tsx